MLICFWIDYLVSFACEDSRFALFNTIPFSAKIAGPVCPLPSSVPVQSKSSPVGTEISLKFDY